MPIEDKWRTLEPISSVLKSRLGSDWKVSFLDSEEARKYSFGLTVWRHSSPPENWIMKVFLSEESVEVSTLGRNFGVGLEGDQQTLLSTIELAAMSLHLFKDPLTCLEEGLITAGIFYLNPYLWSDPSISGVNFARTFSIISENLSLEKKYLSFIRSLHFLSQLDHLPDMVKALKALAVLGIAPPLSKRDLFYVGQLSPIEIKVLTALSAKEAIDRLYGIDERKIVSLLVELLGLRQDTIDKRKLLKSIVQRESKEGLTLSEISHILNIDKAYLWRDVLPKMKERFLVTQGTDKYRGKEIKTYRPNVSLPTVSDMVLTFMLNLSYLVSRG